MIKKITQFLTSNKNSTYLFITLMFLMSFAEYMLYNPMCPGHDFNFHFNRLYTLIESMNDGTFPNYMDYYVIHQYGYLSKIFYSDFLLIPFAIIGVVTDAVIAMKVMLFTLTFLSGLFTYFAFKAIIKKNYGATIAAILYAFASYRLLDIHIRSAMGEVFAITFLPLILWGAYEVIMGNYKKWYILSIGFSLLIYSHVISSLLSFLILLVFIIISYRQFIDNKKRLNYLFLSGCLALIMSSYYIFPMIEQTLSNTFFYSKYKLLTVVYSYNINEVIEGMLRGFDNSKSSYFPKIGALLTFTILLRGFVDRKDKIVKLLDKFLIVSLVLLFATTHLFPWDKYPFNLLVNIQFGYRLNIFINLFFAFCGSYYIYKLAKTRQSKIAAFAIVIVLHITIMVGDSTHYKNYICNNELHNIDVEDSNMAIIGAEYLPLRIPKEFQSFFENRGQVVKATDDSTTISNFNKDKGHITFDAEVANTDNLELPLTYYKGYKATLDGEQVECKQSEFGLIEVPVNKSGKIEVEYVGTAVQKISWYITLISIVLLAIFAVIDKRKSKQVKQENI